MKSFLAKRWFLLVLLTGVVTACLRPGWLRPAVGALPPRAVVAAALFLMAWGLESRSLWQALSRPLPALWAVFLSYAAVPALAWLAGPLLPEPDYRIGLLVMASVPCTLASAVLWTRMAHGNEATALLIILLATATSWLATTACLALYTGTGVAVDSADLMRDLVLCLIVPVALGQLCRLAGSLARAAARYRTPLGVLSQLLVIAIILKAAVSVGDVLGEKTEALAPGPLLLTATVCVGIHLAALMIGLWSSKGLRFDRASQIAIAFGCSQKTLPVALLLFEAYYQEAHPLAVLPMAFYHVGQLVVDTFIADGFAQRDQRSQ